ncbi:MAG: hypothetical protein HYU52_14340 [Acidobacteria bacterium]|nr:hypothetical protein [Acidobacteriota bacterium]
MRSTKPAAWLRSLVSALSKGSDYLRNRGRSRSAKELEVTRSGVALLAGLLLIPAAQAVHAQSIFTFAGGGTVEGRPATAVALYAPEDIHVDLEGNIIIAEPERHQIRRVAASSGVIVTIAGTGSLGSSGDGGQATAAALNKPSGVASDVSGNIYIADTFNNRVRRVDHVTGKITTFAGGSGSGLGDGGPATAARLVWPTHVAADRFGNVFVNDSGDIRIRRIDPNGRITTIAGNGTNGFSGDGGPGSLASLYGPRGIAADSAGNVYVADYQNRRVRRIDATSGLISTFAGNGSFGSTGDGGQATAAALHGPRDVWVDAIGNVLIGEINGSHVRRVDGITGIISTIAGGPCCDRNDGLPATTAYLEVDAIATDASGNLFVAETSQERVRRIDAATRLVSTIAGIGPSGNAFIGDGGPATYAILSLSGSPEITRSRGVALDALGNVFIADQHASRIRRVDASTGFITTIAGGGTPSAGFSGIGAYPSGVAVDRAGNLYVADPSYRRIRRVDAVTGLASAYAGGGTGGKGDGGPATKAGLGSVSGLAIDSLDNLFLIDDNSVRRIDAVTKIITTVAGTASAAGFSGDGGPATAAKLFLPSDIRVDANGNLFIADSANNRIRRVDHLSGTITTVAGSGQFGFGGDGGAATAAKIWNPTSIAVDHMGNLYIADESNSRIRRVNAQTGVITTYAGIESGSIFGGYSGDNGPATAAGLARPAGLAVNATGDLFIVDSGANRVRRIFACVGISSPQLTSPANGSSGVSISPLLRWSPTPGAFRYDVYLDTVSPPLRRAAEDITATSQSISNLEPLTTYYWKVVAKGDPYCSPARSASSEVRSFITTIGCRPPAGIGGALP